MPKDTAIKQTGAKRAWVARPAGVGAPPALVGPTGGIMRAPTSHVHHFLSEPDQVPLEKNSLAPLLLISRSPSLGSHFQIPLEGLCIGM